MKTYQRFMTEKKGDTAVFAFGRFNPPTIGHEKLVIAVANVSRSWGGDFFIYPSHTQDSKKNPLNQATKIKYMKKMFPKFSRNIVASTGKTALEIASELYDRGYKTLVMVAGSDRVQEFQRILDTYNGQDKKHGFYDFDKIEVVSAGERDPDAEGVSGMSASKMRQAAVEGDFKTFSSGIPNLSDKDKKQLMNDIRKGMRLEVVKEGSKWKNIDFNTNRLEELEIEAKNISYKGYTSRYLDTCPEASDVFDEMINSLSGLEEKDMFYVKESLVALDEFLHYRNKWSETGRINQKDFFEMEQLSKKYIRFMSNIRVSEHFDNSFIYKYISEVSESVQYEEIIDEGKVSDSVKWLMKKAKLTKHQADKIVQKAAEKGIDLVKLQTKWSILSPSLMALVAEYDPEQGEKICH